MIEAIRYWFWKRRARKAVAAGLIAQCCECDNPIVPGDFVGVGTDTRNNQAVIVHAGYHFSLTERHAFCETGAIGSGVWNGTGVVYLDESLASKALRTGQTQAG